jgi:hypothetical protein
VTHYFFSDVSFMTRPAIDNRLMLSMTVQAPAHIDFDRSSDTRHCSHITVAARAEESGANMHHVREIDMVRHMVHPDPGNRFFFSPVHHQLFYFRGVLSNEQVAGPAVRNCGNAGNARLRSIAVTEEARNAVVACMYLMAEGNRLDRRAVPKVQRQNVHEHRTGDKGERSSGQSAKKIGYFHAVYPGATDDRTDLEDPSRYSPDLLAPHNVSPDTTFPSLPELR